MILVLSLPNLRVLHQEIHHILFVGILHKVIVALLYKLRLRAYNRGFRHTALDHLLVDSPRVLHRLFTQVWLSLTVKTRLVTRSLKVPLVPEMELLVIRTRRKHIIILSASWVTRVQFSNLVILLSFVLVVMSFSLYQLRLGNIKEMSKDSIHVNLVATNLLTELLGAYD